MSSAKDAEGQPVAVGDPVMIPGFVREIKPGETHNNIAVETEEPMFPGGGKTLLTLNANQLKKNKQAAGAPQKAAAQKK